MHPCSLLSVERKQQQQQKKRRNMENKVCRTIIHILHVVCLMNARNDENGIKRSSFFKPLPNSKPSVRVGLCIPVHSSPFQFSSIQSCFASQPRPDQARLPARKRSNARYAQKCPNYNQRGGKDEVEERGNLVSSHS